MPGPMLYFRPHLYENTKVLREQKDDLERRIAETERLQGHPKRELIESLFNLLCDIDEFRRKGACSGDSFFDHINSFLDRFMRSAVVGLVLSLVVCVGGMESSAVFELRHFGYLWACVGFVLFCVSSLTDHLIRRSYKERMKKIKILFQENPELLPILKTKVWIPDEIANPTEGAW